MKPSGQAKATTTKNVPSVAEVQAEKEQTFVALVVPAVETVMKVPTNVTCDESDVTNGTLWTEKTARIIDWVADEALKISTASASGVTKAMGRPKRYETPAARQKAYRERQRG